MSFKDIFIQSSCGPIVLCSKNHFCNFGREHYEEHFCEIILNLDQWFRRRFRLKILLI